MLQYCQLDCHLASFNTTFFRSYIFIYKGVQWCIAKNRGGYTLETRRRYIPVYAVLLWQMR